MGRRVQRFSLDRSNQQLVQNDKNRKGFQKNYHCAGWINGGRNKYKPYPDNRNVYSGNISTATKIVFPTCDNGADTVSKPIYRREKIRQ